MFSGLLFLLPVVVYILSKLGIVPADFLRKYRRHSIVGVLILSALITPPDFISQVIVSIPILILYEVGIIVAKRNDKQRLKMSSL
jgi:sec-independent protein translocase protein TatC